MRVLPEIKAYSKTELRILVNNPGIDLTNTAQVVSARKKRKDDFNSMVYPIVANDCIDLISLDNFKKLKIVPANVVERIFGKLIK